jgi:hypothetical protein
MTMEHMILVSQKTSNLQRLPDSSPHKKKSLVAFAPAIASSIEM